VQLRLYVCHGKQLMRRAQVDIDAHRFWGWLALWLSALGLGGYVHGQVVVSDTAQVDTMPPFEEQPLSGPWQARGQDRSYLVPFEGDELDTVRLLLTLDRPSGVADEDTLYLYFEGVAWEAELLLNRYYLGVNQSPFVPWVVPVLGAWLQAEGNLLALRLHDGRAGQHEPRPFLGIFRPGWLLSACALAERQQAGPQSRHIGGDTVAVVAPWFGPAHQHSFDSVAAIQRLLPLYREGIQELYFWYEPGQQLRQLCQDLGLRIVDSLRPATRVAFINAYPYEMARFDQPPYFWLDTAAHRTTHYGRFLRWESAPGERVPPRDRSGLALILLLPLLGAALIKLSSPGFFAAQGAMLSQPTLYIENTFYNNISSTGALLVLTMIRMLVMTCFVALLAYYCAQHQLWPTVSLITERSLFFQVFGEASGLGELWLRSLLVIALMEGIRHLVMGLIGQVFQIKGLLTSMVSLDVVGSYPLVLLLGVPMGLLLLAAGTGLWLAQGFALLISGLYWLRKVYVNFQGLDRGASFSSGMKFLYICTFNITSILIWL
jgi:hypothetical protein